MVKNASVFRASLLILPLAIPVLVLAALLRGAEYDEQYTLFLTGQVVRPDWGEAIFPASRVRDLQAPVLDPAGLAWALRGTDVHPPLYFWLIAAWRRLSFPDLLTARLFSGVCAVASLVLVGVLARRLGVPPLPAMALTLGCHGFVHTGAIARGFALAILLTLVGAVLLTRDDRPRPLLVGAAFGAACCANYLACFAAIGFLAGRAPTRHRPVWTAAWASVGAAPFLAVDLWFFLAQRGARPDQFAPFDLVDGLALLARAAAANVLGGLPRHAPEGWIMAVTLVLAAGAVGLTWIGLRAAPRQPALACAALAPPAGLLALGALFDNTPIEVRYLSFSVPFIAILLAAGIETLPPRPRPLVLGPLVLGAILAVQTAAVAGLVLGRETHQPARETARAAAHLAQGGVVLVPSGNDGVGIVGAFGVEAPASLRMLVVPSDESPEDLRLRIGGEARVVIAALAQDPASRATIPRMVLALDHPCWRPAETGFNTMAFNRVTNHPEGARDELPHPCQRPGGPTPARTTRAQLVLP